MPQHSARDHATWSASATSRNWHCPGAIAYTEDLPEAASEPADWGTCAHQIAEQCLLNGTDADIFIGKTVKGKAHSFEVDEEMAETAQAFVDYVRGQAGTAMGESVTTGGLVHAEHYFSLEAFAPPFDAGGTADAVIYHPKERRLEVVDLKGGRGVVEVADNPQLRTYALGAMLAHSNRDTALVTSTIVQPRAPHKDGRVRSETFHVADLVEWSAELMDAMERSNTALARHKLIGMPMDGAGLFTEAMWADQWLRAGSHCRFCRAEGFCPALEKVAIGASGVWFDDLDKPNVSNTPDKMSVEAAVQALDMADAVSSWVNAVRAYWHAQAEAGVTIPGYVLVPKQGREKWNDGVEAEVEAAVKPQLTEDKYLNKKLKTPKQIRKALGDRAALIAGLSFTPSSGTNLVRADKTHREPVAPKVDQFFQALD